MSLLRKVFKKVIHMKDYLLNTLENEITYCFNILFYNSFKVFPQVFQLIIHRKRGRFAPKPPDHQ
jgi:hypothetical protein